MPVGYFSRSVLFHSRNPVFFLDILPVKKRQLVKYSQTTLNNSGDLMSRPQQEINVGPTYINVKKIGPHNIKKMFSFFIQLKKQFPQQ